MIWDRPKTPARWLLLLVPAAICVIATALGGLIDPKEGDWMGWALVGLLIATITTFIQSIWLARVNPTAGGKVGVFFLCFIVLMLINFAVSFAGCAAGSTFLPGLNFH